MSHRAGRISVWLLVALAIPRLIRLIYPAVWVEDDLLLQCSFAVSKGLRPYIDFAHPQMPLLEWVGGLYIRLVGASHVAMEVLNGVAIYITSVLLFLAGRRAVGARAATAASLLYASHSLVFRYHVWTREYFVSALVLGALLVLLDDTAAARTKIVSAAALLCAACAIKLTAGIAVLAIVLYLAFGLRAPVRAAALGLAVAASFGACVMLCYWRYGGPFVFQAFLFHFLKGSNPDAGPSYVASLLDVLGPLGLLGLAWISVRHRWNHALGFAVFILAANLLFYGVLSPTAWGHNYLEPWPFVALIAGAGVAWLVEAWRTSWLRLAGGLAIAGACLLWITPFDNESALRGSVYGFGFVPRRELAVLATALQEATRPDDEVIAPSFIAFEAGRLQAVRFPENIAVMKTADDLRRSIGFRQARERLGTKNFFDLINETSGVWVQDVARTIAPGGRVNAIIPDSPIQLLPLVDVAPPALADRGFHMALQSEHFTLWTRHVDHSAQLLLNGRRTSIPAASDPRRARRTARAHARRGRTTIQIASCPPPAA